MGGEDERDAPCCPKEATRVAETTNQKAKPEQMTGDT